MTNPADKQKENSQQVVLAVLNAMRKLLDDKDLLDMKTPVRYTNREMHITADSALLMAESELMAMLPKKHTAADPFGY